MSVDGWSDDGSGRLICADPGGGGGPFISTVFLGYPWPLPQPASPALPSFTPGVGDFSIEVWVRRKFGNNPGNDEQFWSGLLINDVPSSFPNVAGAIRWGADDGDAIQIWFSRIPPAGTIAFITTCTMAELEGWTHMSVNFDRDLNMELFRDNRSEGATSIAALAGAMGAMEVSPLASDHAFPAHDPSIKALGNYAAFPVMIGPFAIHNRLLTSAERQDSFDRRTVQDLGSATTKCRYEWQQFEGETGWDNDTTHMLYTHKFGLSVPGAFPFGAPGTVKALDSSGNNLHWTLPTQATAEDYESFLSVFTAEEGKWPMCFGVDAEFR